MLLNDFNRKQAPLAVFKTRHWTASPDWEKKFTALVERGDREAERAFSFVVRTAARSRKHDPVDVRRGLTESLKRCAWEERSQLAYPSIDVQRKQIKLLADELANVETFLRGLPHPRFEPTDDTLQSELVKMRSTSRTAAEQYATYLREAMEASKSRVSYYEGYGMNFPLWRNLPCCSFALPADIITATWPFFSRPLLRRGAGRPIGPLATYGRPSHGSAELI
ncbi:MAG: hypothetical protein ACJ746_30895 [Bryobacteraceae bacterium]